MIVEHQPTKKTEGELNCSGFRVIWVFCHLIMCVFDEDYSRKDTGSLSYGFINSFFQNICLRKSSFTSFKQLNYFIAIVIFLFVLFLTLLVNVL